MTIYIASAHKHTYALQRSCIGLFLSSLSLTLYVSLDNMCANISVEQVPDDGDDDVVVDGGDRFLTV